MAHALHTRKICVLDPIGRLSQRPVLAQAARAEAKKRGAILRPTAHPGWSPTTH